MRRAAVRDVPARHRPGRGDHGATNFFHREKAVFESPVSDRIGVRVGCDLMSRRPFLTHFPRRPQEGTTRIETAENWLGDRGVRRSVQMPTPS
jgi:hypothetical protein